MTTKSAEMRARKFTFRKHTNIGAADASSDAKFLEQSFVDSGALEVLQDMNNPQCIVLGRTGSGKTALLERVNALEERVIKINPEGLALAYIASSDVLRFFLESGVDLDLFYKLLWRHVFAVEIIRKHFNIINEQESNKFWAAIEKIFNLYPRKRIAVE